MIRKVFYDKSLTLDQIAQTHDILAYSIDSVSFVDRVVREAVACIGVNTAFANQVSKELETKKIECNTHILRNENLITSIEVTLNDLVQGIRADPSNPLDARDAHMLVSQETLVREVMEKMYTTLKAQDMTLHPAALATINTLQMVWRYCIRLHRAAHPIIQMQQQEEEEEIVNENGKRSCPGSPTYSALFD